MSSLLFGMEGFAVELGQRPDFGPLPWRRGFRNVAHVIFVAACSECMILSILLKPSTWFDHYIAHWHRRGKTRGRSSSPHWDARVTANP
jgi:hypothetical protein